MIEEFIRSNFKEALEIQSGFEHDQQMVDAIQNESLNTKMVNDWMRNYGLFQGIKTEVRDKIANKYTEFAYTNKLFDYVDVSSKFQELHESLKSIQSRKWLSATSKLLWCIQPKNVVIYDAFVERAILVLQCLDEDLAKLPRINTPPDIQKDLNSFQMTQYYMNYQNLVNCLFKKNKKLIETLKSESNVKYEYDIRILDKLLWIMGNFKEKFVLNHIICKPEKLAAY